MARTDTLKKILELAENSYHGGEYREAIQLWEKALSFDPENSRAREGAKMARMLIEAGEKQPEEKRVVDETADSAEPEGLPDETPDSLAGVGNLQDLLEDNQAVANDIQTHIDRGWDLLKKGDRDGALQECQEALVLDAGNSEVMKLHEALSEGGDSVIEEVDVPPEEDDVDPLEVDEPSEQAIPAVGDDFHPPAIEDLPTQGPDAPPGEVTPESPPTTPADTQAVPPVEMEGDTPAETIADITLDAGAGEATEPEAEQPVEPVEPIVEEDHLVPDALKAGGTEYGQWENEFSELDLDQSIQNMGTTPGSETAAGGTETGESAPDIGVTADGDESAPQTDSESDPEPIPLTEPGEIVMPETLGTAEAAPAMPGSDADAVAEPEAVPEDENEFDDAAPELVAPVLKPPPPKTGGMGGGRSLIAIILVVGALAAGGWFFFLRGTGYSADREQPDPEAAGPNQAGGTPEAPPLQPAGRPPGDGETQRPGSEEIQLPPKPDDPQPTQDPDTVRPLSESEKRKKVENMLRTGRQLYRDGKYEQAHDILSGALAIDPVNFELKDLLDQVSRKEAEEKISREALALARRAFEDGDFEIVLRKLYRTPTAAEQEPTRTYIRNTWFNWGVQLLKAGNCPEAKNKLQEVQEISPDDQEIAKLLSVADRYSRQAKDDIFYAFIDQLHFRDLESP
jgi:tetratricopeptide (TPR) repeat protein